MKKHTILSICVAGAVFLAGMWQLGPLRDAVGTGRETEPLSRTDFLFNTVVSVTLYDSSDSSILDDVMALCKEYENIFSKTLETSELYRINHRAENEQTITVSEPMAKLLEKGLFYCRLSDGAFDITVEPLTSLWNFTDGEKKVPDPAAIDAAASRVGYENLSLSGNTLTFLSPDTTIDLGAIAKGYIADQVKSFLLERGVKSAIINLGGNVLCVGGKPDGGPFRVSLQKPFAEYSETLETLDIYDLSVVTSGVYERYFEEDGKLYHHILDPSTGWPYDNGLIAVTVLTEESVDGDALSTTLFSMGLEKGKALAESLDGVYACFIGGDYEITYTDGFENYIDRR